jgi:aromatase
MRRIAMSGSAPHVTVRHSRAINASASSLYSLIAQVTRWPAIFEPCVHAQFVRRGQRDERIRMWATVGGAVNSWTSSRTLDPRAFRIDFRQEHDDLAVSSMRGHWIFRPRKGGTDVTLVHEFSASGKQELHHVEAAVEANSNKELAALARIAEQPFPTRELLFSFTDAVHLPADATDVYRFLADASTWPERLPHVKRLTLRETGPGIQDMEMRTRTADGREHVTRSIRLCSPPGEIVYKQVVPPATLLGHSGVWSVRARRGGCLVIARHTAAIDGAKIAELAGASASTAQARAKLRELLRVNGRATRAAAAAPVAPAASLVAG